MANEFKIKNGLIINNTQVITGISNSVLTNDSSSLSTSNNIKNYVDSKSGEYSQNGYIFFNSGGTLTGTSSLTFDGNNLSVVGNINTFCGGISDNGGQYINLINKTGSPTVKGKLVTYISTSGNSFVYYPSGTTTTSPYIGVIMVSSISNDQYCPIVIDGICDILICNSSSGVSIGDALSTYVSLNDGEIGWNDPNVSGQLMVARALENGNPGDTIKCLLFCKDTQLVSGY